MSLKETISNFGKREALVYIVLGLWIITGVFGGYKHSNFTSLATYFGSLTAYVATYVWGESKRPSEKTSIFAPGPTSRREIMIYVIVALWAIAGFGAIQFNANLNDLSIYFVSLTGFIASWIAGEVYKSEDSVVLATQSGQNGINTVSDNNATA